MEDGLGPRFGAALALAHELHAGQWRKGRPVPYLAHLLGVCSLVLEAGGDEDEAIAALLHDAVEDQGGAATLERIRARFGERVAAIVMGCTDTEQQPKPPWRARKEAHLAHLAGAGPSVHLVCAADKLHNVRALLDDWEAQGEALWARFRGGREGTLWYYRHVAALLLREAPGPLTDKLARAVAQLDAAVG